MYINLLCLVDSCTLFLDIQEVTLLLGEYTLFARANLYYTTTRLHSYSSTIFVAHIRVYTHTVGCKRSFRQSMYAFSVKHSNISDGQFIVDSQ